MLALGFAACLKIYSTLIEPTAPRTIQCKCAPPKNFATCLLVMHNMDLTSSPCAVLAKMLNFGAIQLYLRRPQHMILPHLLPTMMLCTAGIAKRHSALGSPRKEIRGLAGNSRKMI